MKQYEVTMYGNRSILVEAEDIQNAILYAKFNEEIKVKDIKKVEQVYYPVRAEVSI